MAAQTDVASSFAAAVATPTRFRIIAALNDAPRSGASLARLLHTTPRGVARHALPLERLGLVSHTVGSPGDRLYTLAREPVFQDDAWAELPIPVRRAALASALATLQATAAAAVDAGGFDRPDIHLTRTPLEFDERGWRQASQILMDAYQRLRWVASERVDAPSMRATALMMLFESGDVGGVAEHEPPAPAADEYADCEALDQAVDIVEELHEMLTAEAHPWDTVLKMVDRLRVVTRAALVQQTRPADQAPAPNR